MPRMGVVTALLVGAVALGACSSGSSPKQSPLGSTPPSTPTSSSTSSTPAPSPSTTAPLSPFEDDPAVKALRKWAAAAAKAFNAGSKFHDPALTALETKSFVPLIAANFKTDSGLRYPGPVPFTPISVSAANAVRKVHACFVAYGFAVNPKTGKSPRKLQLVPLTAEMVDQGEAWLLNRLPDDNAFSCTGVRVVTVRW